MDYNLLIVSMCIGSSTRMGGGGGGGLWQKTFFWGVGGEWPTNTWFSFLAKNGLKSGSKFKKMAQKNIWLAKMVVKEKKKS